MWTLLLRYFETRMQGPTPTLTTATTLHNNLRNAAEEDIIPSTKQEESSLKRKTTRDCLK